MGLFGPSRPAALHETCDRCGEPGYARFAKDGVVCIGDDAVEVKRVDLVLCKFHVDLNGRHIAGQGFMPVEVAG